MENKPVKELSLENQETVSTVEESISDNGAENSNNCIQMANTNRGPKGLEDRVELESENMGSRAIKPKGEVVISEVREGDQLHGNEPVVPDAVERLTQLLIIEVRKQKKRLLLNLGIDNLISKDN
ncbi:hypothetical protein U1Q18_026653 [Sarracenia purpurea var. burkii]